MIKIRMEETEYRGVEGKRRKKGVNGGGSGALGPEKDQMSLGPREGLPAIIQGSKNCSGRNLPPCSCCQDGAPSLLLS